MDWYSWLLKTNLDPTLVHEYGLAFVRNELQEEDISYFNHEFLQSIGIYIAKHRLEILKLAKNKAKRTPNRFSRLLLAINNKTKKLFTKNIGGELGFHKNTLQSPISKPPPHRDHWSRAIGPLDQPEKSMIAGKKITRSGLLDRREQEKLMGLTLSGPLYGTYPEWSPVVKAKERHGFICRSPGITDTIDRLGLSPQVKYSKSDKLGDDYGTQSLWPVMFQDMKPT